MKALTTNKQRTSKLIKQANGTISKVMTMIDNDQYCPEIIQQIDSVIGLLNTAKMELLAGHLDHCLQERLKENKTQTVQELIKIYKLSQ